MSTSGKVFTNEQRELLSAILDRIIPPQGELPGAGALGVADFVEGVVGDQPVLRRLFLTGLAEIEIYASQNMGGEFSLLNDAKKDSALAGTESGNPSFFGELVRQTYNGYYTNLTIFRLLGYSHESTMKPGEPLELLDPALLDRQRQRPPIWREA